MATEIPILRAYALATQGRYEEAEEFLRNAQGALDTLSGADLLARIRFEQGDIDSARRIWEEILRLQPENEAAKNALEEIDNPTREENTLLSYFSRKRTYVCIAVFVLMIVLSFSIGKFCGKTPLPVGQEKSTDVIAEQTLEIGKINGRVLSGLRDGILTNMTESTVLVLSGGRGKYATDRARSLSVVADCIRDSAKIPSSNILFSVSECSQEELRLSVVFSPFRCRKGTNNYAD